MYLFCMVFYSDICHRMRAAEGWADSLSVLYSQDVYVTSLMCHRPEDIGTARGAKRRSTLGFFLKTPQGLHAQGALQAGKTN